MVSTSSTWSADGCPKITYTTIYFPDPLLYDLVNWIMIGQAVACHMCGVKPWPESLWRLSDTYDLVNWIMIGQTVACHMCGVKPWPESLWRFSDTYDLVNWIMIGQAVACHMCGVKPWPEPLWRFIWLSELDHDWPGSGLSHVWREAITWVIVEV